MASWLAGGLLDVCFSDNTILGKVLSPRGWNRHQNRRQCQMSQMQVSAASNDCNLSFSERQPEWMKFNKNILILQWKLLGDGEIWRRKAEDFVSRECVRVRVCVYTDVHMFCVNGWRMPKVCLQELVSRIHFFFCLHARNLVPVSGSLSLMAPLQKLRYLSARSKLSEIIKEMKHL